MHFLFSKLEPDEVSTVGRPGEPSPRTVLVSLHRCILCTWVVRSRESSFRGAPYCADLLTPVGFDLKICMCIRICLFTCGVLLHVSTCTQEHVSRRLTSGVILLECPPYSYGPGLSLVWNASRSWADESGILRDLPVSVFPALDY